MWFSLSEPRPGQYLQLILSSPRQRTQLINALRGHLAVFGLVASKGPVQLKVLQAALNGPDTDLPAPVRQMGRLYLQQIGQLTVVITRLADELEAATWTDDDLWRFCTVPGIGPVIAGAIAAFRVDDVRSRRANAQTPTRDPVAD
jgi:transposase